MSHPHGHGHPVHARDRTLVLRILVPSLRTALRDKMAALEEKVTTEQSAARQEAQRRQALAQARIQSDGAAGSAAVADGSSKPPAAPAARILDLDGVSCAPLGDGSTLWSFRCDGTTYPARLVNLPCPVEVHKTYDHALYYKCVDVGQVLIVYEDMNHLEEAEGVPNYRIEGYPSYYHSGLTPPMKRAVERRFEAREHRSVAPSRAEVTDVERELKSLIERISKDTGGKGKAKAQVASAHAAGGRAIEEVVEDVVDYEPWMDDNGRVPGGVTFDERDVMATKHPEVWLDPGDIVDEKAERKRKEDAAAAAAAAEAEAAAAAAASASAKKKKDGTTAPGKKKKDGTTKKKKKKKKAAEAKEEEEAPSPTPAPETHHKKGIPSLKAREAAAKAAAEAAAQAASQAGAAAVGVAVAGTDLVAPGGGIEVDEVTQVATQIANMEGNDEELLALDDFFNFDGDDDFADIENM